MIGREEYPWLCCTLDLNFVLSNINKQSISMAQKFRNLLIKTKSITNYWLKIIQYLIN